MPDLKLTLGMLHKQLSKTVLVSPDCETHAKTLDFLNLKAILRPKELASYLKSRKDLQPVNLNL